MVLAVGDERRRTARLRVIKVRSHHTGPTPITLAESSMADIDYKLAILVYKCLYGLAPSYLVDELYHPCTRLSTYSDRAFPVATVYGS